MDKPILCPSAPANWQGSQLLGVMVGSVDKPEMAYLPKLELITNELLEAVRPCQPEEVMRFTAPCANEQCAHFSNSQTRCQLAEKVVHYMPIASEKLPACHIRRDCRWYVQEGKASCLRCSQIVTHNLNANEVLRKVTNID